MIACANCGKKVSVSAGTTVELEFTDDFEQVTITTRVDEIEDFAINCDCEEYAEISDDDHIRLIELVKAVGNETMPQLDHTIQGA